MAPPQDLTQDINGKLTEDLEFSAPTTPPTTTGLKSTDSSSTAITSNDGKMDPVVIIGMSVKFPQEAVSVEAFWDMLMAGRSSCSEVPKERYNVDAFYSPGKAKTGMLNVKSGHFLQEDITGFDAPFFSMTPTEVASMDPLQRLLLETSFQGLENAGIAIDQVKGSRTSVYIGSFLDEYGLVLNRDLQMRQKYRAPGTAVSMLANRLSWFYDLRGPSIALDTACSSSLVALHLACQSIRAGESEMSIVGGCNLTYNPDTSVSLSELGFLSPDGISYSFDQRANGYARGEGFGIVILKSLSRAIQDGDTIRAVIRASGSNQDGRTPGITQPSGAAQETLIRETYQSAGLDMAKTAFVEAHATGTVLGDPIEATALGNTFKDSRQIIPYLLVGTVKSNIGHLEAASGIAGLIKAVISLEKGIIPPNVWPKDVSKRIPAEKLKLKFPTEAVLWPTEGLRRASVNSFGFGGANAHVVLDDAFHYMSEHGVLGRHNTAPQPTLAAADFALNSMERANDNEIASISQNLFLFSAPDEEGLKRLVHAYRAHLSLRHTSVYLEDLAYTLAERRTKFRLRHFAVASSAEELKEALEIPRNIAGSGQAPKLCFVFTGQGAQWHAMGRELLKFPAFRKSLEQSEKVLRDLGCQWWLIDELLKDDLTTHFNKASYSQPICTALQIALVQQLAEWSVKPSVVIGHSSGEIAAAYCTGALSLRSACQVAYFRGYVGTLLEEAPNPGAMLAVGLSEEEMTTFLNRCSPQQREITIACINSPRSITLSGSKDTIDAIQMQLEQESIFVRRLPVQVAYHSPSMNEVAQLYLTLLANLHSSSRVADNIVMLSSLTGSKISTDETSCATYWVQNMTSPVKFAQALGNLASTQSKRLRKSLKQDRGTSVDCYLEIGPHSTLKGAINATLGLSEDPNLATYTSLLVRGKSAIETAAISLGSLWSQGYPADVASFNNPLMLDRKILVNLPSYPFDHSRKFWLESRISHGHRFRQYAPLPALGTQVPDWSPLEPRWRNIISVADHPWIKDHNVNGIDIYPAAGMLVMAMEAAYQMSESKLAIKGYRFKDISIHKAIAFPVADEGTEVQFYFRPGKDRAGSFLNWHSFRICAYENGDWSDICTGWIATEQETNPSNFSDGQGTDQAMLNWQNKCHNNTKDCKSSMKSSEFYALIKGYGLNFGPSFCSLHNIRFNARGNSLGTTNLLHWLSVSGEGDFKSPIIHPAALDAFLQLACLGLTNGGRETLPTMVPTVIRNFWVSGDIAHMRGGDHDLRDDSKRPSINIHTESKLKGFRHGHATVIGEDTRNGSIVLTGEFNVTGIAEFDVDRESALTNCRKLCFECISKPDPELMVTNAVYSYCSSGTKFCSPYANLDQEMTLLGNFALRRLVNEVQNISSQVLEDKPHLRKYLRWAEYRLSKDESNLDANNNLTPEIAADLLTRVARNDPQGNIMANVIKNLTRIMRGEVDALEVIFQESLATEYYHYGYQTSSGFDDSLRYIELFAHKRPAMRILEIGSGTGSATGRVLGALTNEQNGSKGRTYLFQEYTFTDISTSFFEAAKTKFSDYADVLQYRTLDIEVDPCDQGFDNGGYDLIVASNVLHATAIIKATLRNVRKLLKPGAKLLLFEMTVPENIVEGLVFGLLPGWWLSTEEYRKWGPTMTRDNWDSCLGASGFSGLDLAFPAHDETVKAHAMIATAVEHPEAVLTRPKAAVITLGNSTLQSDTAKQLQLCLKNICEACDSFPVADIASVDTSEYTVCVSLLEIENSFLDQITKENFNALKFLFSKFDTVLWVSSKCARVSNPLRDMTTGLARSIRAENETMKLVTINFQKIEDVLQAMMQVSKVLESTLQSSESTCEVEFDELDGSLCIKRIADVSEMDEFVSRRTTQQLAQLRKFRHGDAEPMKLAIGQLGLLNSLRYEIDTAIVSEVLAADEIEIEVRAAGVNFRDILIALGQDPACYLGLECSGVVIHVGVESAARFKVGDRVCCIAEGCLRTNVRCHYNIAFKIPDDMSFASAAAFPIAYSSAYYSLQHVARLKTGETILIHSGAGALGQACIQLAKLRKANIFVTVGADEKKEFLMQTYGIEECNIFSSRSSDFVHGIKTTTNGRGVDVIINSLAGEALRNSWECIAPFGRFVELGKKDIYNFGNLPMFPFSRSVTFSSVDIFYIYRNRREILTEVMESSMALFRDGKITVPYPVQIYHGSEVETAFRYMESGRSKGKLVIEFHDNDVVLFAPSTKSNFTFDPNATYLISGGLGGLGRSIARWMVSRSAKHLILLSRSHTHSKEVTSFLEYLRDEGTDVATPPCDVGDIDSLKAALQQCHNMPPIRGCVQASMVLQDSTFANMTLCDFKAATAPKVQGSWNLHTQLPRGMDFFILLSSFAGVAGSRGQSNYAAGNTYQDALAIHRNEQGERAMSLDLGKILSVGYVAENEGLENIGESGFFGEIQEKELHAMIEYACDPDSSLQRSVPSQVITGMETPAFFKAHGMEEPYWITRPLFSSLYRTSNHQGNESSDVPSTIEDCSKRIAGAKTLDEVSEVIIDGLQGKLSRTLAVQKDNIDVTKPMHTFGVDSLSAVELRSWFRKVVGVDITVFDILGNQSLADLAATVATKSQFLAEELRKTNEI